MKINKYPDGSSYVEINNEGEGCYPKHLSHKDITFTVNSYEDLWHLNQLVDAWNNQGITPTVTIPNLIDAQADKRFEKNQSSGLKLVCKFLNGMDARFKIFHPHNPEVVEALIDGVKIIDNSSFIRTTLEHITDEGRYRSIDDFYDNLILMSSDSGGFKPLMKLVDKINWGGETYSASKSRKYVDGKSTLVQRVDRKDFEGKDILIIDDLSIYGGTFKGLSTLLKERNVGRLYLAVSHMTIQNLGEDPITNYFDKVFTTNSKFESYPSIPRKGGGYTQPINLEIIKIY